MSLSMQALPDNVRNLKPVPVVIDQPTNEDIMSMLVDINAQLADIRKDIAETKGVASLIMDNVKPTLDMLTNGPIGQILGIAPPPAPRTRRGR